MAAFVSPIPLRFSPSVTKTSRRAVPLCSAQRIAPFTAPSETTLSTFSSLARGEWKGYEGRFTPDGEALTIPDYYIPEEFLEWGLTPHGFESVHSVIVRGNKLYRKFFRILPSVSLFGDHVDTEEEFGWFELDEPGVSIFEDGSWIRGEARVRERVSKLEKWPRVEVCVRHPHEKRAVTAVLPFDWAGGSVVDEVRVVLEEWVCEYCDGADMDSGSGFVEGWVVGDRVGECAQGVLLPQGIDFGVSEDGGEVIVWVGWAVGGERVSVRRRFGKDGHVLYSERVVESGVLSK